MTDPVQDKNHENPFQESFDAVAEAPEDMPGTTSSIIAADEVVDALADCTKSREEIDTDFAACWQEASSLCADALRNATKLIEQQEARVETFHASSERAGGFLEQYKVGMEELAQADVLYAPIARESLRQLSDMECATQEQESEQLQQFAQALETTEAFTTYAHEAFAELSGVGKDIQAMVAQYRSHLAFSEDADAFAALQGMFLTINEHIVSQRTLFDKQVATFRECKKCDQALCDEVSKAYFELSEAAVEYTELKSKQVSEIIEALESTQHPITVADDVALSHEEQILQPDLDVRTAMDAIELRSLEGLELERLEEDSAAEQVDSPAEPAEDADVADEPEEAEESSTAEEFQLDVARELGLEDVTVDLDFAPEEFILDDEPSEEAVAELEETTADPVVTEVDLDNRLAGKSIDQQLLDEIDESQQRQQQAMESRPDIAEALSGLLQSAEPNLSQFAKLWKQLADKEIAITKKFKSVCKMKYPPLERKKSRFGGRAARNAYQPKRDVELELVRLGDIPAIMNEINKQCAGRADIVAELSELLDTIDRSALTQSGAKLQLSDISFEAAADVQRGFKAYLLSVTKPVDLLPHMAESNFVSDLIQDLTKDLAVNESVNSYAVNAEEQGVMFTRYEDVDFNNRVAQGIRIVQDKINPNRSRVYSLYEPSAKFQYVWNDEIEGIVRSFYKDGQQGVFQVMGQLDTDREVMFF